MEYAGNQASQHAGQERHQQGGPEAVAIDDQHGGYGTARGDGAVHRQVGNLQDAVGDVHANGHDTPDHALGGRAGQLIEQLGKIADELSEEIDDLQGDALL